MKNEIMQERILPNILVTTTGCWEWQKHCAKTGYGEVSIKGKPWYTHRLVCTLYHGEIKSNQVVRHLCDNRPCCNPDHLAIGSRSQNGLDSYKSGRRPKKLQWTRKRKPSLLSGEALIAWVYENAVDVEKETSCWNSRGKREYATIYAGGKTLRLHRFVYCTRYGMDYNGKFVIRHKCHNKSCVNPEHLTHGTQRQNSIDSRSRYKHVKLTEQQVIIIAESYRDTSFAEFGSLDAFTKRWAKELDMTPSSIYLIVKGKTWSDVTQAILHAKPIEWTPRIPSTQLNPTIVGQIKADMNARDFTMKGEKRKFDQHWAKIVNMSERLIASIRTGHRWEWVA